MKLRVQRFVVPRDEVSSYIYAVRKGVRKNVNLGQFLVYYIEVTRRGRLSKIGKNEATSFMDDP